MDQTGEALVLPNWPSTKQLLCVVVRPAHLIICLRQHVNKDDDRGKIFREMKSTNSNLRC